MIPPEIVALREVLREYLRVEVGCTYESAYESDNQTITVRLMFAGEELSTDFATVYIER